MDTFHLLFALNAFLIVIYYYTELRMIHAGNPTEYLARLRLLDLAAGELTITLVLFVWSSFGTGRKWLGILSIACMGLSLTADLMPVLQQVFASQRHPFGHCVWWRDLPSCGRSGESLECDVLSEHSLAVRTILSSTYQLHCQKLIK